MNILSNNSRKFWNLISFSAILFILSVNDTFTSNSFAQNVMLGLGLGFAFYWMVSIFVFLFNSSLYTSYTVVIQSYWKRALYIFWALELFLFSIFVYLVLVSPTEVEWLLDQPQLFESKWWDGALFFNNLLPILAIILLTIISSYLLLNGSMLALLLVSLCITGLLLGVLFSDMAQTYLYTMFMSGLSWDFDLSSSEWVINGELDKTSVITQYMFLVTVLKFWHTLFIVAFWLMSVMFLIQSPYVGQGVFASNKQNFFFLYGFAFLWLVFLYNTYANYSYEYVYQWFFVNPWGTGLSAISNMFGPVSCLL